MEFPEILAFPGRRDSVALVLVRDEDDLIAAAEATLNKRPAGGPLAGFGAIELNTRELLQELGHFELWLLSRHLVAIDLPEMRGNLRTLRVPEAVNAQGRVACRIDQSRPYEHKEEPGD